MRINSRTVEKTLANRLPANATLLKDAGVITGFAAAASAGEPLSLAHGVALILKTSGSVISVCSRVLSKVGGKTTAPKSLRTMQSYERFQVLFYVACQRSYLAAMQSILKTSSLEDFPTYHKKGKKELQALKERLNGSLAALSEAELDYLYCVEPLESEVPLLTAFDSWLQTAFQYYGFAPSMQRTSLVRKINAESRKRFRVFLASDDKVASWMNRYLAISERQRTSSAVIENLTAIRETLTGWTDPSSLDEREREAWEEYRTQLQSLPDQKETMFNEAFGVRKVFVQPEVYYRIAGSMGEAGKPARVTRLDQLLGALLSNRSPSEDLIIVS